MKPLAYPNTLCGLMQVIILQRKKVFNYRLSRARRYVECAFGILCNKWRILHRLLNVSKALSKDIVKACIILHNVVRLKDAQDSEIYVSNRLCNIPRAGCNRATRSATDLRDSLLNYFVSKEGALPWQMNKI